MVHENQMLDLLQKDLDEHHAAPKTINIQDTQFIPSILAAFNRQDRAHPNGKSSHPQRAAGESLATGIQGQLGTIVNTKQTHWFALVLDFSCGVIWYGDSLHWSTDAKIRSAIEWWIQEYTSAPFTHKTMPVTYQRDSVSCGLLAWNSLSHHFLPAIHPLINPLDVAEARLRVLLSVCKRHQMEVSVYQTGLNYLPNVMKDGKKKMRAMGHIDTASKSLVNHHQIRMSAQTSR